MTTDEVEAGAVDIEETEVDTVLFPKRAEEQEDSSNDEMDDDPRTYALFVPEERTVHQFIRDYIDLNNRVTEWEQSIQCYGHNQGNFSGDKTR